MLTVLCHSEEYRGPNQAALPPVFPLSTKRMRKYLPLSLTFSPAKAPFKKHNLPQLALIHGGGSPDANFRIMVLQIGNHSRTFGITGGIFLREITFCAV